MRLLAFDDGHGPRIGRRLGEEVVDLTAQGLPASIDALLPDPQWRRRVEQATRQAPARLQARGMRLLPPLAAPGKAIAVGLNYHAHAQETKHEAPQTFPTLFTRYPSSWVGHEQALQPPAGSARFDYEAELVIVIGSAGRHIARERALEHVAGYSLFNDGSARDLQFLTSQWMAGKNFDASGGFGPELVTADELPAGAGGLRLLGRLNGRTVQDAKTDDMIFDVASLIEACSRVMTLHAGDMIISGTPEGVGMAREPALYLQAGDVFEVEVEGIGLLRNSVGAP